MELLLSMQYKQEDDHGGNINHANLKAFGSKPKRLSGDEIDILHFSCKEDHQEEYDLFYLVILQSHLIT